MLLKAVPIAALAFAFVANGQDPPEMPKPAEKQAPLLDTEHWMRGQLDKTPRKRNFVVTPELKVTPGVRENADGKCSIPLREIVPPHPNARIKVLPAPPPQGKFHMRFVNPPAPPCAQANLESAPPEPKPAPTPDPQPRQK